MQCGLIYTIRTKNRGTLSYSQEEGILFVRHLYGCSASNINDGAAWDSQSGLGGLKTKKQL